MRTQVVVSGILVVGGWLAACDGGEGAVDAMAGAGWDASAGGATSASGGSLADGDGGGADGAGGSDGAGGADGAGGSDGAGGADGAGGSDGAGGADGAGGSDGAGGGSSADSPPAGTFLMDEDGYVVFEAEDITNNPPGNWVLNKDAGPCSGDCSPSGGAYLQYVSASLDDCGQHGSKPPSESMSIKFQAKQAGFYRLAWRNLRDHRAGDCAHDRNNDSFVSFPGAKNGSHFTTPFKVYGGGSGSFNWNNKYDIHGVSPDKEDVCLKLDAGVQTMTLAGRSNYHVIDRIALIRTGTTLQSCRGFKPGQLDKRANTGQAK